MKNLIQGLKIAALAIPAATVVGGLTIVCIIGETIWVASGNSERYD